MMWEIENCWLLCRHYRSGDTGWKDPFLIWTDHKNLVYFRSAKRPNSRQARWSLSLAALISRAHVDQVRNLKPNALSRPFSPDSSSSESAPILHSSCFLGAAQWEIEAVFTVDQQTQVVVVRQIACLSLRLPAAKCCSGDMPQHSPAILVFSASFNSSSSASGGRA